MRADIPSIPPHSDSETLQLLLDHVTPLPAVAVTLDQALGRVLRRDAHCDSDQPAFDRSGMDGYAIAPHPSESTETAYVLAGEVLTGQTPTFTLQPGQCARVFTGAMIPPGTVRVVKQEDAEIHGVTVRESHPSPNAPTHIRYRGEDCKAGDIMIPAGQVLRPSHVSILASIGITDPLVARKPRVAHIVSGSEIVHPLKTPGPGQIRDSNTHLLAALCAEIGASVRHRAHAIDDEAQTLDLVASLPDRGYDILLFSGGSGAGSYDFCRAAFAKLGFTLRLEGVALRPGKPLLFATRGSQLAFGLPGNPLSHFVLFQLFVRPVIRALQKAAPENREMTGLFAVDATDVHSPLKTYRPAYWYSGETGPLIEPLPWNGSGHLASLSRANALLIIPPHTESLKRGDRVTWLAI
ncbi:MAG: hypothetical protein B9S32_12265 [Verrucomicrobia bacterium Tous-C9LFEB]|nr:MAG: hypothetical protein B9S32_12265 [Verrucomicrobia bacterium Tous-C9LFEB]